MDQILNADKYKSVQPVLISVVTVVYNGANCIEQAITSVISQSFRHIEYIIIDGASTDETINIVKKYESAIAYWKSEPDEGIYDAMNKALQIANGDWIFFLGSDDVLFNSNVMTEIAENLTNKNAIYYGNALFKKTQKLYNVNISKWFLCLRNISHQTIFYPRMIYKKYKYNVRYSLFSDHIYNINLFSKNEFEFIHLPITTVIYNDAGSSSEPNDPHYFNDLPAIVSKTMGKYYGVYVYLRLKFFLSKKIIVKKRMNIKNK